MSVMVARWIMDRILVGNEHAGIMQLNLTEALLDSDFDFRHINWLD